MGDQDIENILRDLNGYGCNGTANWKTPKLAANLIADLQSAIAKSASREAALVEKLNDAYEEGWHACACWADRDDLHCDTSSKAYTEERDERLAKIKEAS